jgi:hypothetical protein
MALYPSAPVNPIPLLANDDSTDVILEVKDFDTIRSLRFPRTEPKREVFAKSCGTCLNPSSQRIDCDLPESDSSGFGAIERSESESATVGF